MLNLVKSTEIKHRDEFALLSTFRKHRLAIEIGTDVGEFAESFVLNWSGWTLFCVDPYFSYNEKMWDREADYLFAVSRLSNYAPRCRLVRQTSFEFYGSLNKCVGPEHPLSFGFIYIDADHEYLSVRSDILLWWNKLSDNGILAGHDFDTDHPGVMKAVSEFAESVGRTVYLTHEDTSPPSWYIYKKEPEVMYVRDNSIKLNRR